MTIRAVIFDIGGVLVRIEHNSPGRRKWEERLGLPSGALTALVHQSDVTHRANLGLLPEIAIWQSLGIRFGLNDASIKQLEEDFWRGEALDMDLIALLRSLRRHYRTAILSNAWSDARKTFTRKFGLDNEVDFMIISAEEGLAKPDARFYRLACERLGIQPYEALFIDDLLVNVQGARTAGIKSILFEDSEQTIRRIKVELSIS